MDNFQSLERDIRQELVVRNRPLAHKIALTFVKGGRGINGIDRDDLHAEALHGLCQAAKRYEPRKGFAFTTFAVFTIRGVLLTYINRQRHMGFEIGVEMGTFSDRSGRECHEAENADVVRRLTRKLSQRERHIVMRRANGDTLREVGESLGISKEWARQLQWRATETMLETAREMQCA